MKKQANSATRFARRAQLNANEYRKNFRQLDNEAIELVSSEAATKVTTLMSKVYLRLVMAPAEFCDKEGSLHFTNRGSGREKLTAWQSLYAYLGVSGGTAHKALPWLREQGVIGYYAGKNGVGIRIFINRALDSIGRRETPQTAPKPAPTPAPRQKNLPSPATSFGEPRASNFEAPFKDILIRDNLDKEINSAPETGAGQGSDAAILPVKANAPTLAPNESQPAGIAPQQLEEILQACNAMMERNIAQIRREMTTRTQEAVAAAIANEGARTRDWWEKKALPKAVRVAQHEAYQILRKNGTLQENEERARAALRVGGLEETTEEAAPQLLPTQTVEQINDLAEICLTQWEIHSQPFSVTLGYLTDNGLCLNDAARVTTEAEKRCGGRSPNADSPACFTPAPESGPETIRRGVNNVS